MQVTDNKPSLGESSKKSKDSGKRKERSEAQEMNENDQNRHSKVSVGTALFSIVLDHG